MTTGIPVCLTVSRPDTEFTTDWYGRPLAHQASFKLSLAEDSLCYRFQVDKAPDCDLHLSLGQFVEGLWEREVAELFVMAPDGRYLEFNVSPTGAWWAASFSRYRTREKVWSELEAKTEAFYDDHGWQVELTVPTRDLVVLEGSGLEQARWNVTAILSDGGEPVYLSWGQKPDCEPDFHRADLFCPATFVSP